MSVNYQNKIVTDGLVLCLDASDPKSYPGTGTTFFDRSGHGNHGEFINNPTYSTDHGGIFQFDGYSPSAILVPLDLRNTTYTVTTIARYVAGANNRIISSTPYIPTNWLLGFWNTYEDVHYAEGWVNYPAVLGSNTWKMYSSIGDYVNDNWKMYKNGNLVTDNSDIHGGSNGPHNLCIGGCSNEWSSCEVAILLAYDRVLTEEEIKQNFNATKGRFGL